MTQEQTSPPEAAGTVKRALIRAAAAWIILPLFFLVTGGSLEWWQAWIYCALLLVPMTCFVVWMARRDPAFLARRIKAKEKEPAQRRLMAWGAPLLVAVFLLPGLDRRFGWSEPPLAVVVTALTLTIGGYLTILRVFLENRWAGRTVETCADQSVISTGPYAIVRHPMYVGAIVLYLATPLALGSWWGVFPALAFVSVFVSRIRNEEDVLDRELPGYPEYRRRVRYRLIPLVW